MFFLVRVALKQKRQVLSRRFGLYKLIVSYTASTDGIFLEELVEDIDYLPNDSEEACLMTVAGARVGFVVAAVCTDRTVEVVTFCENGFGVGVGTRADI